MGHTAGGRRSSRDRLCLAVHGVHGGRAQHRADVGGVARVESAHMTQDQWHQREVEAGNPGHLPLWGERRERRGEGGWRRGETIHNGLGVRLVYMPWTT